MLHYKSYIKLTEQLSSKAIADAVKDTVSEVVPKYISNFDFINHHSGLLLGNVQSGKTSHMLGLLASAADHDFEVFIVMTADNTHLQQQTLKRTLTFLDTFCVCDEQDDIRFLANDMRKPVVIVLKKNRLVLETWLNRLISSKFLVGRALFITDDESDAASLNTKVNKDNEISTINHKISTMKKLANSSFFLQVTATPQSLFLQEEDSGHRPEFVHYFKPGEGYLGGNFFYRSTKPYESTKPPYPIRITDEEELSDLKESEAHIPEGMQKAIMSFLVSAAHVIETKSKKSCNFLIHPSVKITDHEQIAERIGEALNNLIIGIGDDDSFKDNLKEAWIDLQKTKPDILDFDECYNFISSLLENEKITISTMNSKSSIDTNFEQGVNIVVGGTCLGRGVTVPNLQTTYYCRKSKKPLADTFWQHCRAFGYDRDAGLVRMFLPASLFKLFSELNNANNAMIEYIESHGIKGLKLIYPKGIKPTRTSVVNKKKLEIIAGGVNHFPSFPTTKSTSSIDKILQNYKGQENYKVVDISLIRNVIELCSVEFNNDWPNKTYLNCISSLQDKDLKNAILIVRRDRNIGRNTGTLLSPNDRKLGDLHSDRLVLTMYRVNGATTKGWDGKDLWIPNIKFPLNNFFYSTED